MAIITAEWLVDPCMCPQLTFLTVRNLQLAQALQLVDGGSQGGFILHCVLSWS